LQLIAIRLLKTATIAEEYIVSLLFAEQCSTYAAFTST
jgi:hypothetical protein